MIKLKFKTTNNEVEYETLLARLTMAEILGAKQVDIRAYS